MARAANQRLSKLLTVIDQVIFHKVMFLIHFTPPLSSLTQLFIGVSTAVIDLHYPRRRVPVLGQLTSVNVWQHFVFMLLEMLLIHVCLLLCHVFGLFCT